MDFVGQFALPNYFSYCCTAPAGQPSVGRRCYHDSRRSCKKIVGTHGRGYGFVSYFSNIILNGNFLIKSLHRHSTRLLKSFRDYYILNQKIQSYQSLMKIIFGNLCAPRLSSLVVRLKNNLTQKHYDLNKIPETTLTLRAQQMNIEDLINVWDMVRT